VAGAPGGSSGCGGALRYRREVTLEQTHDPLRVEQPDADREAGAAAFEVHLDNFEGPFDLLLSLIAKHRLDVTEVALSQVTDEFLGWIRSRGPGWDLGEASEFLVVAATLLDLKAARLLPTADVEDEEDLALLEARDLLFARLLQYRAFKEAAAHLGRLEQGAAARHPRAVPLEPRYTRAVPEVLLDLGLERLAQLAADALTPRTPPTVLVDHVHAPRVSVREHAALLRERVRRAGAVTFRALCGDCRSTLEVVARFLALLELYREGLVGFEQVQALGELHVRWSGGDDLEPGQDREVEVDEYVGAPAPGAPEAVGASGEDA